MDGFFISKMITIELTKDQADFLSQCLCFYQDEGPEGEGWKSDELEDLIEVIDSQIEKQK